MTDIAHELARQVLDRGEVPAGNDITLDPGQPVFDLVEPGRVGRRVVEVEFRVSREELLNPHGLMSRQVVCDNVDLLAARLVGDQVGEESHKFLAGGCAAVLLITSPLLVLRAYSESVPCRLCVLKTQKAPEKARVLGFTAVMSLPCSGSWVSSFRF